MPSWVGLSEIGCCHLDVKPPLTGEHARVKNVPTRRRLAIEPFTQGALTRRNNIALAVSSSPVPDNSASGERNAVRIYPKAKSS